MVDQECVRIILVVGHARHGLVDVVSEIVIDKGKDSWTRSPLYIYR